MTNQQVNMWALKIKILTHYSNGKLSCVKCGFDDIRALSLDHINGGGSLHRRQIKTSLYYWIQKNNYPTGYQTLCYNCQRIKYIEEDAPKYIAYKGLKLIDKIRIWIDAREGKFKLNEIKTNFRLTDKEYNSARSVVWRLAQEGKVEGLGRGYYKKLTQPISVSSFRFYSTIHK